MTVLAIKARALLDAVDFDGSNLEQMALAIDFCAEINRARGITPEGLLDMAKRLYEVGGRI